MPDSANIGRSAPLGVTLIDGGANFSLFSRSATGVELLFFDREDDINPSRVVRFDPAINRTYHYWHAFVPGVQSGTDLRLPSGRPIGSGPWTAI